MTQRIVGLVGLRGSGKDTAGQILVEDGWQRIAFADALYVEVAKAFGVTVELLNERSTKELPMVGLALKYCTDQLFVSTMLINAGLQLGSSDVISNHFLNIPRSPREILQQWGTEYRRDKFGSDYWRKKVSEIILANPKMNFVITDVRYPDEAEVVKNLGGKIGRIVRPGLGGTDDPALLHISERAMLEYPVDSVFINEEGTHNLYNFRMRILNAYATSAYFLN